MTQETAEQAPSKQSERQWLWILVALAAHTGWGAYPVLARYLQTVSNLPSLSLLTLGNLLGLCLVSLILLPSMDKRAFGHRLLWIFGLIVVVRGLTNFLAARYTLSIYVQLVTQMTPFLVALLSTALLQEQLPRYTGRAITLCLAGALLMMSGNIDLAGATPDPHRLDWLGILLAGVSSLALAVYMIFVRRSVQHQMSGEALFVVHLFVLGGFSAVASLGLDEEWSRWRQAGLADWLVFATFSLGVLVGANLGQIGALRRLGAPLVSSLLAWRLVSAMIVGMLLLDERLSSPWQVLGAVAVLVTITWYLWQQRSVKNYVS